MGRKPIGKRPMTRAEKEARRRKRVTARHAARDLALQEIVKLRDMTELSASDRMHAMAAVAEKALTHDIE